MCLCIYYKCVYIRLKQKKLVTERHTESEREGGETNRPRTPHHVALSSPLILGQVGHSSFVFLLLHLPPLPMHVLHEAQVTIRRVGGGIHNSN